jgi:hypothetical protein
MKYGYGNITDDHGHSYIVAICDNCGTVITSTWHQFATLQKGNSHLGYLRENVTCCDKPFPIYRELR